MTEPTGILDRLGRMASDLQTRCEEYHAQLDDLNTCRCSEDITALDDARAAILQYREERDRAIEERDDALEARDQFQSSWLVKMQHELQALRERDALVEALKGLLDTIENNSRCWVPTEYVEKARAALPDEEAGMSDRAWLGARMAEAMGWEHDADSDAWIVPEDIDDIEDWVESSALVTWQGYGWVDQFMREQGWNRATFHDEDGCVVAYHQGKGAKLMGRHKLWRDHDEPRAAIEAALKALGESDD